MKKAYLLMLLGVLILMFAGQGSFGRLAAQAGENKKDVPEKNGADAAQSNAEFRVISPRNKYDSVVVPYFKRYLKNSELVDLSAKRLPKDDLEVRVWRDAFKRGVSVFVLKRVSGEWSATFFDWQGRRIIEDYPSFYYEKPAAVKLAPQVSSWDGAWGKLTDAGILTLPSARDIGCPGRSNDGTVYFVEYSFNNTYRTYLYDNPGTNNCLEGKQILEMISLIRREYYTTDVDVYKD